MLKEKNARLVVVWVDTDPKVIDDLLIIKNSSDQEHYKSLKSIVEILEKE